jgi:hypothetical protein
MCGKMWSRWKLDGIYGKYLRFIEIIYGNYMGN